MSPALPLPGLEHPLLERLVLASIELTLMAGAVYLLARLSRRRCPRTLCLLWIVVLLKPLLSLTLGSPLAIPLFRAPPPVQTSPQPNRALARSAVSVRTQRAFTSPGLTDAEFLEDLEAEPDVPTSKVTLPPAPGTSVAPVDSPRNIARYFLIVWVCGTVVFLVRYGRSILGLRSTIRRARPPAPALQAQYSQVASELGLKRPPWLLVTDQLESPALVGAFRPVILLPRWHAAGTNRDQLSWSLRHELLHWQWLDPVSILIRDIVTMVFWFHPVAWWSAQRLTDSIETACDHAMVRSSTQAGQYAEHLYEVLKTIRDRRRMHLAGGLFATRTQIGRRIAALLDGSVTSAPRLTGRSLIGITVLSAMILAIGTAVRHSEATGEPPEPFPARVVRFPINRSLGSCSFLNSAIVNDDAFGNPSSTWGASAPLDAQGAVAVPAGQIVKLNVTTDTYKVDHPFASLKPDDLQIISFRERKSARDDEVEALSHLTGLIGLDLYGPPINAVDPPLTAQGIRSLTPLSRLEYLTLPSIVTPEGIEALSRLPSLRHLLLQSAANPRPEGAVATNAHLAALGRLTSLTHLRICGGKRRAPAAGLASLEGMKTLRLLAITDNESPELNQHLRHIGSLTSLEELELTNSAVNDEGLEAVKGLVHLHRLDLTRTRVTDEGLAHLADLPELEELRLAGTHVGDAGMRHLERLKKLRRLDLSTTSVTAVGVAAVSRISSLEQVCFPGRALTDESLPRLAGLPHLFKISPFKSMTLTDAGLRLLPEMRTLDELRLTAPKVTDAAMPYIAGCSSLQVLSLSAGVTDAGLQYLPQLKQLRRLVLHNMKLNGEGLRAIGQLPELRQVDLMQVTFEPGGLRHLRLPPTVQLLRLWVTSTMTEDDLKALEEVKSLRYLYLNVPTMTDRDMEHFAKLPNLESLRIHGNQLQITDAGLLPLEHLATLRFLNLRGTPVTEQGIAALRAKLPGLKATLTPGPAVRPKPRVLVN